MVNRIEFSGLVADVEPMRMTPAGVPTRRFTVTHESEQMEAGLPRRVTCSLRVVALGEVALAASRLEPGTPVELSGFLARASHRSEWPVLHATQLILN